MSTLQDKPASPAWAEEVRRVARAVRRRVHTRTLKHNGGYLSQACSAAEILVTLYLRVLRLGPSQGPPTPRPFPGVSGPSDPNSFTSADYNGPRAPHLDRFLFCPVHTTPWCSILS